MREQLNSSSNLYTLKNRHIFFPRSKYLVVGIMDIFLGSLLFFSKGDLFNQWKARVTDTRSHIHTHIHTRLGDIEVGIGDRDKDRNRDFSILWLTP